MKETLTRKPMYEKFPKHLDNEEIDIEKSFQWMKHRRLNGETEVLIIAAQDYGMYRWHDFSFVSMCTLSSADVMCY